MEDELRLIKLAVQRDEPAFEKIYRRYLSDVYSLALKMTGDAHGAEDITQEIFVRLWHKINMFNGKSSFRTWLYRLSFNVIIRQRKVMQKNSPVLLREDFPAQNDDHHNRTALKVDLNRAILTLPPRGRAVTILHDVQGFTHQEIAGILGISPGTSKTHLHKARKNLRRELEK